MAEAAGAAFAFYQGIELACRGLKKLGDMMERARGEEEGLIVAEPAVVELHDVTRLRNRIAELEAELAASDGEAEHG